MIYFKRFIVGILILLTCIIISLHFFSAGANADEAFTEECFQSLNVPYQSSFIPFEGHNVRAITTGTNTGKLICFVHGAPGAWNAWDDYLTDSLLRAKATLVSVDRLGYGKSNYGHPEHSLIKHADAVKQVIDNFDYDTLLLVGHSYGGAIVGYLAAQHLSGLQGTIMLAPVIDPEGEKIFWFNPILNSKLINWSLPGYVKVANSEKLSHAEALLQLRSVWQNINTPILHMHCSDDWIAPFEVNVNFSQENIDENYLQLETWEGASHFIPFNSFELVRDRILSF